MHIFEDKPPQSAIMHHKLNSKKMDYSHCPLKKRPVHFVKYEYIKEENMDFDNTDECLEPENLSTKPQDLSVKCKSEPLEAKKELPPPYEHHENAVVPLSSPYYHQNHHQNSQQQQQQQLQPQQHQQQQEQPQHAYIPYQPTPVKAGPLEPLCLNIATDHHGPSAVQGAAAMYHHHHRHYAPATPRPVPAQYPSTGYLAGYMYQHQHHVMAADRAYPVAAATTYPQPPTMAVARDASLSPPGSAAGTRGSAFRPLMQLSSPSAAVQTPTRSPPAAIAISWYGRPAGGGWSPSSADVDLSPPLAPPSSASSASAISPSYGPPPPPSHRHAPPQLQYMQLQYSGDSDVTTTTSGAGVKRKSTAAGGSPAGRYKCTACSKTYSTVSGLTKHQQYHCADDDPNASPGAVAAACKTFCCKYCDKAYNTLGALKMHIRTHTLPCICKLCGKAFSRPWLLQGHIRTHTGEKPFSCQHCNRAFADRSNLRAHLQTHSDVKKYSCPTCSKTFSRMSLLTKHCDTGCPRLQPLYQQQQQVV